MAESQDKYEIPFQIISLAGDSRSKSLEAIEKAKEGKFEEADALVVEATKRMEEAHKFQNELITNECKGNPADMNILLIHAQDHLSMSIEAISLAKSFVFLAKQIAELKSQRSI